MTKVGDIFYSFHVDDETLKSEFSEYTVRTIRGGKIYAIEKNCCTWGRRSKKHGDFGWLESFNPMWRHSWRIDGKLPWGIFRTKLMAVNAEIKLYTKTDWKKWYGTTEDYDKYMKKMLSVKKRLKNE